MINYFPILYISMTINTSLYNVLRSIVLEISRDIDKQNVYTGIVSKIKDDSVIVSNSISEFDGTNISELEGDTFIVLLKKDEEDFNYDIPSIGSTIHFYEINDKYFLLKNTACDTKYVSAEKISIFNDKASLAKILLDLIEAINKLTVTTAAGPSGNPINKLEFDKVKEDINKLLF